ncbi:MAG: hypothetical protein E7254_09655 [Lachnospiraceae bacterium]|nr:hypothetical protein [Lachnospiraceae bacterium]
MKSVKRIVNCFLIIIVVAIVGLIITIPVVNDNIARKEMKRLKEIPLPKNTQCLEYKSKAGKLSGNGNGMQYVGMMLIKSDLEMSELEEYYKVFSDDECEIDLFPQNSKTINYWEHVEIDLKSDVGDDGYYIVYSWTDVYSKSLEGLEGFCSEFDLRGN